jgi:UDP-N-acetylglucosamine--N-acetylmuramyl-(pentapeptide) pyrophosphoryl-undecaprenol N-acetylglucosamine transferase
MRIVLTGGGSGGHFYPIIAVATEIKKVARENKLVEPELYYFAPVEYDKAALFDNGITWVKITAGKMRRYFSILNFFTPFQVALGVLESIRWLYKIYPDVVFGKGGFVSFPVLLAARILRIPVVIHESDTVPGRTNMWAGKFADRVALSFSEASRYFKADKVAHTGHPVRRELIIPVKEGSHDYLKLEEKTPTVLILGGSQGSQIINDNILDSLPVLVEHYQIIHQTGQKHFEIVTETAKVVLQKSQFRYRYHPYENLDILHLRMCAGAADIIVSRAGSTIFEIAAWGLPSIIIPITSSNGDHQRKNAYAYASAGAAEVIEETNLSPHVLVSEINRVLGNPGEKEKMIQAAKTFSRIGAAELIAKEIINIALPHEFPVS